MEPIKTYDYGTWQRYEYDCFETVKHGRKHFRLIPHLMPYIKQFLLFKHPSLNTPSPKEASSSNFQPGKIFRCFSISFKDGYSKGNWDS